MATILAADIGGTSCRFGYFQTEDCRQARMLKACSVPSSEVGSFAALLDRVEAAGLSLSDADRVVLAVAGVVRDGVFCQLTNVAWSIDLRLVSNRLPLERTTLVNDFVAQAVGCVSPFVAESLVPVQHAEAASGIVAVVGAGTGLGHCALIPRPGGGCMSMPLPSEGGHAPLACISDQEFEFQRFLGRETGYSHLFGDIVVSGRGLSAIHHFLTGVRLSPAAVAAEIGPDSETTVWFARFFARACRAYVLQVLAGSLFLCGGLAAKNPWLVTNTAFVREFCDCPAYTRLLARIPISLVTNPDAGLIGAAMHAQMGLDPGM